MAERLIEMATREGQNIIAQAITQSSLVVTNAERAEQAANRAEKFSSLADKSASDLTIDAEAVETMFNAIKAQYGYPFTAATSSAMTDTSKIYVYTGATSGNFTKGHWYYHNGTAWTDGGVFNSEALQTDHTLSIEGEAADAKAVGDKFNEFSIDKDILIGEDYFWKEISGSDTNSTNTDNGTITVDTKNKKVEVQGIFSDGSATYFRPFYSQSSLPSWLEKGVKYFAYVSGGRQDGENNIYATIDVYWRDSDGNSHTAVSAERNWFSVPQEAVGVNIRVCVHGSGGQSVIGTLKPTITKGRPLKAVDGFLKGDTLVNKFGVASDVDYNTLTDTGFYFISAAEGRIPHETSPIGNNAASLIVMSHLNGIITQILHSAKGSGSIYIRRRQNDGVTWTDWLKVASGEDTLSYKRLAVDADLNEIKETGFYYLSIGSGIEYANNPLGNVEGALMQVFKTNMVITQMIFAVKTNRLLMRNHFSDTWKDWTELSLSNLEAPSIPLKILFIGHSTTEDGIEYAPFIMQNVAPEIKLTLGDVYNSGATPQDYLEFWNNDSLMSRYSICKPNVTSWTINSSNKTLKQALRAEKWDVIVFGWASTDAVSNVDSAVSALNTLIDRVVNYVATDDPESEYEGHPVKVGLHISQTRWGKNSNPNNPQEITGIHEYELDGTAFNRAMTALQQAVDKSPIEFVISGCAAWWNARGTSLDQYGNARYGSDGGHMLADYAHLQEGIGIMVSSYTTVLKLLELAGVNNKSILGESTRPDLTWVNSHNIPGRNYGQAQGFEPSVVGISDENCLIAQKCAIAAHKKPFEISTIV